MKLKDFFDTLEKKSRFEQVFPECGFGPGITKRELFAALAMYGIISTGRPFMAQDAIVCADTLIKELEKTSESKPAS